MTDHHAITARISDSTRPAPLVRENRGIGSTQIIAEILESMAHLMVDRPQEVSVDAVADPSGVTYRIKVSHLDVGKLIGQGGRTARSMRQILQAIAMTQKIKINLDIAG